MNWMIEFCMALGLTAMQGSILFLYGFLLEKMLLPGGRFCLLYKVYHWIVVFFFCPVVYLLCRFVFYNGFAFTYSSGAKTACSVLFLVWMSGFWLHIAKLAGERRSLKRMLGKAVPCKAEIQALCENMQKELGMEELYIKFLKSSDAHIPFTCGAIRSAVILPDELPEGEPLHAVITHELIHVRQMDVIWKHVLAVLQSVYWFLPVGKALMSRCDDLCEAVCDLEAGKALGGWKKYFEDLLQILTGISPEKMHLVSGLANNRDSICSRIESVRVWKMYGQSKGIQAGSAAVLFCEAAVISLCVGAMGFQRGYTAGFIKRQFETFSDEIVSCWMLQKGENWSGQEIFLKEGDSVYIHYTNLCGEAQGIGLWNGGNTKYTAMVQGEGTYVPEISEAGYYSLYVNAGTAVNLKQSVTGLSCEIYMTDSDRPHMKGCVYDSRPYR